MVEIAAGSAGGRWFGIAWANNAFVSTAVAAAREDALAIVSRCIPADLQTRAADDSSPFLLATVRMLGELERGDESHKQFVLSDDCLSPPLQRIFTAAASIPIGYVTSYGNIASVSGSEARAVGRAMATNPLYPIVPCHRVVGSDLSLVGYYGRQDPEALGAKLGRLEAEARGETIIRSIELPGGAMTVYPAEWVIERSRAGELRRARAQERKTAEREAEDRQLRLF